MNWLLVLPAGVVGGCGAAGLIGSAFATEHWAAWFNRLSPGYQRPSVTSISLAGGAGVVALTVCLIAVVLDQRTGGAVAATAIVAVLVGIVCYTLLRSRIVWLAALSLPLSLVLLAFVLFG